jgi:general secretion pathway protein H
MTHCEHESRHNRYQQGFTLLEILLVITIIAIMAGMATLAIGGSDTRLLQQEARRLQQVLLMAQDRAAFKHSNLGLQLTDDGYRFLRYSNQSWIEMDEKPFAPHQFELPLQLDLQLEGADLNLTSDDGDEDIPTPEILVLASGENSAFALELSVDDTRVRPWILHSDGFSSIALEALNENH